MADWNMKLSGRFKAFIIAGLVGACLLFTYYHHAVLNIDTVFTHLYYLPVIFACMWWKKRGLWVAGCLGAFLIFSGHAFRSEDPVFNNYSRTFFFLIAGYVVARLSENIARERRIIEERQTWYRALFENTGTATVVIGPDRIVDQANGQFEVLSGLRKEDIEGKMDWLDFISDSEKDRIKEYHESRRKQEPTAPKHYEFQFKGKSGEIKDVYATATLIPETQKTILSIADLSELKQAQLDRKALQERLSEALTKVLSGYIAICANCKKIRNESNSWIPVESYVRERTSAQFSHGICPECARKLYPDMNLYQSQSKQG